MNKSFGDRFIGVGQNGIFPDDGDFDFPIGVGQRFVDLFKRIWLKMRKWYKTEDLLLLAVRIVTGARTIVTG